jgi:predicted  nucleic acid-binding Zn-ribbon protein
MTCHGCHLLLLGKKKSQVLNDDDKFVACHHSLK